jgi:threonine synthase
VSAYTGKLACLTCGHVVEPGAPWSGCPACAGRGVHSNVLPVYALEPAGGLPTHAAEPGIFRYRELLPIAASTRPVSLHEGSTPLLASPRLAAEVGVGTLAFKDETRNPTWSYKDRLAAVAVTRATEVGAGTVALATTGNHGAAAAAYAAAAGLRCVVLTLASVPRTMKILMQSYGANVVALERGPDRWELLAQAVRAWGWMPLSGFLDPPIGSNPFGVDGYKTIAYELHDQLGGVPDAVVVPTAYGDGLAGIERGFRDLVALGVTREVPRMIAVDPFGAYEHALASAGDGPVRVAVRPTVAFSIGTPIATLQGLAAIRATGGTAVGQPDDRVTAHAQRRIAETAGLFLEASSALCLPAVAELVRRGDLDADDRVVCIATSSGLKDVDAATTAGVPLIRPTLPDLARALAGTPG